MRSVEILSALGLLNGSTLLMGLQRGLASSADVEGYCMALLGSSEDHDTALLASARALSLDEVERALQRMSADEAPCDVGERWRLAMLVELEGRPLSAAEKIEALQLLYAELDYPEDMAACSIYSADQVDPLEALSEVIVQLKERLCGVCQ